MSANYLLPVVMCHTSTTCYIPCRISIIVFSARFRTGRAIGDRATDRALTRSFLERVRNRRPDITAAVVVVGVALRADMKSRDSAGSGLTLVRVGHVGGRQLWRR